MADDVSQQALNAAKNAAKKAAQELARTARDVVMQNWAGLALRWGKAVGKFLFRIILAFSIISLQACFASHDAVAQTNCDGLNAYGASATTGKTVGNLNQSQMNNAATIIATGQKLSIPPRGIVIALMTAMQESTMRNLSYGDRDSLGLFQQRDLWSSNPSRDANDPRLQPAEATRMFFEGGNAGQRGLRDIKGWESMPLGTAAQKVQVSAFPYAYAKWQGLAESLYTQVSGSLVPADATTGTVTPINANYVEVACSTSSSASTGYGDVPTDFNKLGNHRTVEEAIAWAMAHLDQTFTLPGGYGPSGRCMQVVAFEYGYDHSGAEGPKQLWPTITAEKHEGKSADPPPPGAIVIWHSPTVHNGVRDRYGHIALSIGDGKVITTDFPSGNTLNIVSIAAIDQWSEPAGGRIGWAAPQFPNATPKANAVRAAA